VGAPCIHAGEERFSAPKKSALHSLPLQPRLRALIRIYGQEHLQFNTLRTQVKRKACQKPHPWTKDCGNRSQHRIQFKLKKRRAARHVDGNAVLCRNYERAEFSRWTTVQTGFIQDDVATLGLFAKSGSKSQEIIAVSSKLGGIRGSD
jgi:hypothetical protein